MAAEPDQGILTETASPMNVRLRIALVASLFCGTTAGLLAALVTPPREPELTGAYEDAGTIAIAPPGDPPPVVSLHALLVAEFMPGLVRILHDQTGEVRLTHTAGLLRAEITNRDGEVTWERHWRQGTDYGMQGPRVILRFEGARPEDDDFLLLLETVTAYKLLQVEVQRHTPTLLGPRIQPMGTYLFHRAE